MIGQAHTAYLGLVEELGLTLDLDVHRRRRRDDLRPRRRRAALRGRLPVRHAEERADYERVERLFGELVATVDPDDPWSHPDARRLDGVSWAGWLRSVDALPSTVRAVEVGRARARRRARASGRRCSPELRKAASVGDDGLLLVRPLGVASRSRRARPRSRCAWARARRARPARGRRAPSISVSAGGCRVTLDTGEEVRAEAVVCALPVSVLHGIAIDGVSPERLASLRAQRQAQAAKVVTVYDRSIWADLGRERPLRGRAPARLDVAAARRRPLGARSARARRPGSPRRPTSTDWACCTRSSSACTGPTPAGPRHSFLRLWATDPFTRGYTTHWWPGDVLRVGPLHGTHEPPFYVCGSDQWVAGYMEGAVRTGRAAAAAALRSEAWTPA